ncbi:MAG: 6-bladed beta-propeller [Acidobacteriota bacterium]|nr:6-bladed beta-propeller [Acidobacteriota bacterium]
MRKTVEKAATVVVALAVIAVFQACGSKDREETAGAGDYPVKIEVVDGVRTILNPAFPKEGVVHYALEEELVMGGEGEGTESVLNRPYSLEVDAQGNVYVLDWGDVDIKVFGPDGRLLRTIGRKGQGPGEFDIPADFILSADGRIFLLSGRQRRISLLDIAGNFISSFTVTGFCSGLAVDRSNRVYSSQMLAPDAGEIGGDFQLIQNRMALIRTDEKGQETTKLGEYPDVTMLRKVEKSGEGLSSQSFSSRESYRTSWLVGPDDRVYLGYNKDYRLDVYDPEWNLLFRFGRDFTPIRHPHYKPDGAHPEFYPAFSDWRKFFDEEGNLWLQQYVEKGDEEFAYDVFTPEGIYLRQVRVPRNLMLVRGDKGYGVFRTEDEFLDVKRFRLSRQKSG